MTIQIVRFKDGLDVISYVDMHEEQVELTNPMMFEIRNQHLLLEHWLPLAVMKEKSVQIPQTEILCFMDPNDDFTEYYATAVDKVNLVVSSKDESKPGNELEQIMDVMEELERNKGIKFH